MWWTLIAQIAGSAVGNAMSQMDQQEAMRLIQSVSDEFGKINVPELKKLVLEKAPDTLLSNIKDDPTYRSQQNQADAQLNDVINSGGLTLADKAALNAVRNKISRGESAGRHAIEQGMSARGSLDSGAQLAMQLQGNQQSAQSASEAGESTTARAQARAYEAIQARARNAGAGLDRSYNQQSAAARAQDAINQGNAAIANTAAKYNANIPQQNFENQLHLTQAKAQPTYALAGAHGAKAKDTQQQWQGYGNMAGAAGNSAYQQYQQAQSKPPDGGGFSNDSGGQDWGNALSGPSTRTERKIIGHRMDGSPIYGDELR